MKLYHSTLFTVSRKKYGQKKKAWNKHRIIIGKKKNPVENQSGTEPEKNKRKQRANCTASFHFP